MQLNFYRLDTPWSSCEHENQSSRSLDLGHRVFSSLAGAGTQSSGEKWLNLHARTMTDIERTHNVGAYVLAIVTAIIVNYTLAMADLRGLNATKRMVAV